MAAAAAAAAVATLARNLSGSFGKTFNCVLLFRPRTSTLSGETLLREGAEDFKAYQLDLRGGALRLNARVSEHLWGIVSSRSPGAV